MSFGENLKKIRIKHNYSQEQLAELLGVSRQAVSRWEQNQGYPEVEMLLEIGQQLNVSLDFLFYGEKDMVVSDNNKNENVDGKITIFSPIENVVVRCNKIASSPQFKAREGQPAYALFAASDTTSAFFNSENRTFLGWYADNESLSKEMAEIQQAISSEEENYTLKYAVKTQKQGWKIKIIDSNNL